MVALFGGGEELPPYRGGRQDSRMRFGRQGLHADGQVRAGA